MMEPSLCGTRKLMAHAISVLAFDEEPDVVSVKFPDPDGYAVEVYWEW